MSFATLASSSLATNNVFSIYTISQEKSQADLINSQQNDSNTINSLRLVRPKGLSATATLINFLKGMIGPGCLALPLALKQAGLWMGFFLIFLFGFLTNHCMLKIVHCSQCLSKRKGDIALDYGGLAFESCAQSFSWLRPYKRKSRIIVNITILLLQIGICSVEYVFISVHLKEVMKHFTDFNVSTQTWMLIIFLPMVLINLVRTLRFIAIISIPGNILMILGLGIVLQYLIRTSHIIDTLPFVGSIDGIMAAMGSILYSFEGQAMVLPMENKLKYGADMVGFNGVLSTGMSLVTIIYAASGFYGYITYGDKVQGSITLNLPNQPIFIAVDIMLILVIYIAFVIQNYVIVSMVFPEIIKRFKPIQSSRIKRIFYECIFRTILVAIAMGIAIAIPNLNDIIPLVGVTAGMLLAFVYPALIDMFTFIPMVRKSSKISNVKRKWLIRYKLLENGFYIALGILGLVAGLQSNIRNLLNNQ